MVLVRPSRLVSLRLGVTPGWLSMTTARGGGGEIIEGKIGRNGFAKELQSTWFTQRDNNKRKNPDSHENKQSQQKLKSSSTSKSNTTQSVSSTQGVFPPPTGYFPTQQPSSSSYTSPYQVNIPINNRNLLQQFKAFR